MAPISKWIAENSADRSLTEVAGDGIRSRIEVVRYFLPRAAFLWEEDAEHVHGLRVATRRAAATLELFKSLLPTKRTQALLKALKRVRKSADLARDLDVYIGRLGNSQDAGALRFANRLKKMRGDAQFPIVDVALPLLTTGPLEPQIERLLRKLEPPADAPDRYGEWSALRLGDEWRRFVSRLPPTDPEPEQLHEFRIAGKRFRYALEILSGGLSGLVRAEIYPQIEKLQGKLGAIQDHAVAAERLSTWQAKARGAEEKRFLASLEADERIHFAEQAEAFRAWWHPDHVATLGRLVQDAIESAT